MAKTVRLAVLTIALVLVAAYAYITRVSPPSSEVHQTPEFIDQAQAVVDAVERYMGSSGFAEAIARQEMEREADKLKRLAHNQFESNAVYVIDNYVFRARMLRIKEDNEARRLFMDARHDVSRIPVLKIFLQLPPRSF